VTPVIMCSFLPRLAKQPPTPNDARFLLWLQHNTVINHSHLEYHYNLNVMHCIIILYFTHTHAHVQWFIEWMQRTTHNLMRERTVKNIRNCLYCTLTFPSFIDSLTAMAIHSTSENTDTKRNTPTTNHGRPTWANVHAYE
jgi:hypothetical protein